MIENALSNAGLQKEEVDWLVMHQANQRIMDAAAERLGLPPGRLNGLLDGLHYFQYTDIIYLVLY